MGVEHGTDFLSASNSNSSLGASNSSLGTAAAAALGVVHGGGVSSSNTTSPPSTTTVAPESFLWSLLGLLLLVVHPTELASWSALLFFCQKSFPHVLPHHFLLETTAMAGTRRHEKQRAESGRGINDIIWRIPGEQGLAMILLTSLWTLVRPYGYTSWAWTLPWLLAQRHNLLSWWCSYQHQHAATATAIDPQIVTVVITALLGFTGLWWHTVYGWYAPGKILAAHFLAATLQQAHDVQQVFSHDEWQIIIFFVADMWLEWMQEIVSKQQEHYNHHDYGTTRNNQPSSSFLGDDCVTLVACAGTLGVGLATSWVFSIRQKTTHHHSNKQQRWMTFWMRAALLVVLPLVLVEVSLAFVGVAATTISPPDEDEDRTQQNDDWRGHSAEKTGSAEMTWTSVMLFSRTIQWLLLFLLRPEEPLWDTVSPINIPRLTWVVYWVVVATAGLVGAPKTSSRVVTRKWFHLIAVLLFTPVTIYAPLLQSLGYAVAVAVLIALEAIRPVWPALQAFYLRYLDPSKDGSSTRRKRTDDPDETTKPKQQFLIISHTALILGCAMPLWCYLMSDGRISPFIPFGGILVLGVGDALAAVIGKWYGHHYWYTWIPNLSKDNKRTLEGSLAMYVGQLLFVGALEVCGIPVQWFVIVPSVLFVSVLEAWTTQMDNIMIPLAFVAFLGLWEQLAAWQ